MPKVKLRVECNEKLPKAKLSQFVETQGDLKSLSETNFEKLKRSIMHDGFFVPVMVWKDPKSKELRVLDGHQRLRVLKELVKEDFIIGDIPYVPIEASDEKDAAQKLLKIASQYGKVDKDGLYKYLIEWDITPDILVADFDLAGIDSLKFTDEFFNDVNPSEGEPKADVKGAGGTGMKELSLPYSEPDHQKVLRDIAALKEHYQTENAADTVKLALARALLSAEGG